MTIYDEVKSYLEKSVRARERSNKNKFIAWILLKKWGLNSREEVTLPLMEQFVIEASSYDRAWRQVLQHEPSLRGTDYGEKEVLEQEKEIQLGYSPTHSSDVKKLKTL